MRVVSGMARLGWSVPLPGPFRVSGTVGGKRRARRDGPGAAESFAAAVDRGGDRLLAHQAAAAERHGGERADLLERAAAVRAVTGDVYAAAIDEKVAHLEAALDGTVQYVSRSRKLRRLLDSIEGEADRLRR